jgi:hypothetical protein
MGLMGFKVERSVAKETVFGLFDGFFLGIRSEFPIDDDNPSLRQVFEWGDDAVTELTGWRFLDLKCSHALDDLTVGR